MTWDGWGGVPQRSEDDPMMHPLAADYSLSNTTVSRSQRFDITARKALEAGVASSAFRNKNSQRNESLIAGAASHFPD